MDLPRKPAGCAPLLLTRPAALSYGVVAGTLALAAWLHLGSLIVTVFFATFALGRLHFQRRKWVAVMLFLIFVVAAFFGFGLFFHKAVKELPGIVADSLPRVVRFADSHGIDLPFSDIDDVKEAAPKVVRDSLGYVGNFAKLATKEFLMLVAGIVIAIGIFLGRDDVASAAGENLYTYSFAALRDRFGAFYRSFETVMGAQLLISLINTVATAVFVAATPLRPYAGLLVPLTFLFGMLPIVGNLLSNTLIVGIALGLVSPQMAVWSLLFLVTIHKLEYLLNSQIIGSRIRHPMWLTLIALILGEGLMGIPGVILAPVLLNFLKVEGSRYVAPGQPLPQMADAPIAHEPA